MADDNKKISPGPLLIVPNQQQPNLPAPGQEQHAAEEDAGETDSPPQLASSDAAAADIEVLSAYAVNEDRQPTREHHSLLPRR
jgi:hypothetical protein